MGEGEEAKKGKVSLILIFHTPALHLVFFSFSFSPFFPPLMALFGGPVCVGWVFFPSLIYSFSRLLLTSSQAPGLLVGARSRHLI